MYFSQNNCIKWEKVNADLINTVRGRQRKEYSCVLVLPLPLAFSVQIIQGTLLSLGSQFLRIMDIWNWKFARVYFTESRKEGF